MNNWSFTGNLGQDCRQGMAGQHPVVNFSVAVKSGYGQNEQTVWVDCAVFGSRATALQPYLTKGTTVGVTGELGTREYQGKTYITCKVKDITLLGSKGGSQGQQQGYPQGQQQGYPQGQGSPNGFNDARQSQNQQSYPQGQQQGYPQGAPADSDIPF